MTLQQKYQELVQTARNAGVTNLQVREQDNVLYIDGAAPSNQVKKQVWDVYNKLDPDYRSADVVMNLTVSGGDMQEYEVAKGDNLTKIGRKYGVGWKEIYEANKELIKNPDPIQPRWKLKIPSKA